MTGSLYDRVAVELWEKRRHDREWVKLYQEVLYQLCAGEYPPDYVDIIFQKGGQWGPRPPDLYDAMGFIDVHYKIRSGQTSLFQIPIGEVPVADRATEEMNEILSRLSYPFKAEFRGGYGDLDGELSWEKPVHALINREEEHSIFYVIAPPSTAGLEVGTVSANKMAILVNSATFGGRIARWPYDQEYITVFVPSGCCYGELTPNFEQMKDAVWGDFHSLPNPYDEWGKWKGELQ